MWVRKGREFFRSTTPLQSLPSVSMFSEVWKRRLSWFTLVLLLAQTGVAVLWFGGVTGSSQGVLLLLACACVLFWLLLVLGGLGGNRPWPVMAWLVIATLVYVTIRYMQADIEYVARREWLLFLACGSQFLVAVDLFARRPDFKLVALGSLIGLAVVAVFLACGQFFGESRNVLGYLRPEQYGFRGSGPFFNPNHFAAFVAMLFFPAVAMLFLGRFTLVPRMFLAYAAAMLAIGIFISVSRGAYAATAAGSMMFLAWLLCLRKFRRLAFILLGGGLIIGAALIIKSKDARDRLAHLYQVVERRDDEARLKIWRSAWEVHQEAPLWGVGPGHFEYRYFRHRSPHYQQSAVRAHNDYLNILADYGVVGVSLLFAALSVLTFSSARIFLRYLSSSSSDGERGAGRATVSIGAAIGLMTFALHCLVDFLIYIPALAGTAALLLAIVVAPGEPKREIRLAALKQVGWLQALLLFLIMLPLGGYGKKLWHESHHLRRGRSMVLPLATRLDELGMAVAREPANDFTRYLLGEHYRRKSALGGENWEDEARTAMQHFEAALQLNPYRHDSWLRKGYCLDWLGRHAEAERAFEQAQTLDPNGATTMAWVGWHWVQVEEYQKAIDQFLRSLNHLPAERNALATTYLPLAQEQLKSRR